MSMNDKTVEELLDQEEELLVAVEAEKDGAVSALISVYQALYRKVSRDKESEYAPSLDYFKRRLIFYLIKHGTYLKTVYKKDDHAAETSLKKAVTYDSHLPIAYYRLGFIQYKREDYSLALQYFQNAIHYQESPYRTEYRLNDQQMYNCHLYLSNCGLFIAKHAKEDLEKMDLEINQEAVPDYIVSPLYQLIDENNQNLAANAYRIISQKEDRPCSEEECLDALDLKNTIIMDFTKREHLVRFNGERCDLSINEAEMLRLFLIKSNENSPINKYDVRELYKRENDNGDIPTNTFIQKVRRLRGKLDHTFGLGHVIKNKPAKPDSGQQTAYYYDQIYDYAIMLRSDELFEMV